MSKRKKQQNPVNEAIRLMKEGFNNDYIQTYLLEFFDSVTSPAQAIKVITEAESIIEKEYDTKRRDVFNLHKTRYNKQIDLLLKIEELPESEIGRSISYDQWQKSRERKVKASFKALETMKQLENLMLITSDTSTNIDINDELNINLKEKNPIPDLSKLTFDEQVELLELMQLAKVTDYNNPVSVKQAILSPVPEAIDIAPIIEEEPNVSQIKQQIEHVPVNDKPLLTPKQKLMESLKKIAAGKFHEVGAKLDQQEQKYLADSD